MTEDIQVKASIALADISRRGFAVDLPKAESERQQLLREVEGLTCEEVGLALGVPEGTVKSRLSRAREAMRLRLRGLVEEGGTS